MLEFGPEGGVIPLSLLLALVTTQSPIPTLTGRIIQSSHSLSQFQGCLEVGSHKSMACSLVCTREPVVVMVCLAEHTWQCETGQLEMHTGCPRDSFFDFIFKFEK